MRMPIFLRKVLKNIVIIYVSGFLFVAAHMPQSVALAASNANPQILLAPAYTPAILRAYGQFAFARIWPFGTSAGTVTLGDLINSHGSEQFRGLSTIQFDMTPGVRPGQEGRLTYELGLENYGSAFYGAFMEITGGGLLRVGQYFCLMNPGREPLQLFFGQSRCFRIILREDDQYLWQELGEQELHAVRLLSNDKRKL